MKKTFLALFLSCVVIYAQDQQDMMKAWMEYMTPGPMHELLSKNVGTWKVDMTMYDIYTGSENKIEGTSVTESILGGRYFKTTYSADMMGMPFEGIAIDGYDNKEKKFYSYWIDNMGTGMLIMKGDFDNATKTFTYTGESFDPMTGKQLKIRSVTKIIDENKFSNEMFSIFEDKEYKMFDAVYTRK
ncbi:DUF1579 domain-containing protein [Rosettibacter firmus]|uniref:DUF1579 domain-containing protein n=1 Tax=Rosettibacter firmus TaxID=3111522 RepID=UPI00336C268A